VSTDEAVWFSDDVDFARAIRDMRPAARRPAVWGAALVAIGASIMAFGLRDRIPPKLPSRAKPAPDTVSEVPLVPIAVAKAPSTPSHHHKSKTVTQQAIHAHSGGLLPRRTFPSWASSSPASAPAQRTAEAPKLSEPVAPVPARPIVEAPPRAAAPAPAFADEASVGPSSVPEVEGPKTVLRPSEEDDDSAGPPQPRFDL
jgi:hypothetical protein